MAILRQTAQSDRGAPGGAVKWQPSSKGTGQETDHCRGKMTAVRSELLGSYLPFLLFVFIVRILGLFLSQPELKRSHPITSQLRDSMQKMFRSE